MTKWFLSFEFWILSWCASRILNFWVLNFNLTRWQDELGVLIFQFTTEKFSIAGVAENNSKLKIQNSKLNTSSGNCCLAQSWQVLACASSSASAAQYCAWWPVWCSAEWLHSWLTATDWQEPRHVWNSSLGCGRNWSWSSSNPRFSQPSTCLPTIR